MRNANPRPLLRPRTLNFLCRLAFCAVLATGFAALVSTASLTYTIIQQLLK